MGIYNIPSIQQKFIDVNNFAIKKTGHGIDICVVDNINLLKFGENAKDITDTLNKYITFFREQSIDWCNTKQKVAMIVVSQANNKGVKNARDNNGIYLLDDFAEASELPRASSLVLTTYSSNELQYFNDIQVGIIKNRDGLTTNGTIMTKTEPEYYTFGDTLVNTDEEGITGFTVPILDEIIDSKQADQPPITTPENTSKNIITEYNV